MAKYYIANASPVPVNNVIKHLTAVNYQSNFNLTFSWVKYRGNCGNFPQFLWTMCLNNTTVNYHGNFNLTFLGLKYRGNYSNLPPVTVVNVIKQYTSKLPK
jgi:hypothetical protein